MRIKDNGDAVTLWASATDTYDWAHRADASWPCSTLSGHRFCATFDSNGLLELTVDGGTFTPEFDGHEFSAICSDLLEDRLPVDHTVYCVTVGQFRG